ncbi:hypothetical protein Cgig2_017936 [Carnegiea gigantea]|uniref:Uncharacterized protein n=1 Tax=Carnegiea gigantea TaxID=171969 RepID=A0A9Q1QEQ8_9CARY|nr:hypothetical protein Cgig2_017936 [Carnegiea gigantea]
MEEVQEVRKDVKFDVIRYTLRGLGREYGTLFTILIHLFLFMINLDWCSGRLLLPFSVFLCILSLKWPNLVRYMLRGQGRDYKALVITLSHIIMNLTFEDLPPCLSLFGQCLKALQEDLGRDYEALVTTLSHIIMKLTFEDLLPCLSFFRQCLKALQDPVPQSDLACYTLRGLGRDYETLVTALTHIIINLTFDDLRPCLSL